MCAKSKLNVSLSASDVRLDVDAVVLQQVAGRIEEMRAVVDDDHAQRHAARLGVHGASIAARGARSIGASMKIGVATRQNGRTGAGPEDTITLKREAFEKWRTGYSSALAIILFVTVFGAANIYVKALNRVKQR